MVQRREQNDAENRTNGAEKRTNSAEKRTNDAEKRKCTLGPPLKWQCPMSLFFKRSCRLERHCRLLEFKEMLCHPVEFKFQGPHTIAWSALWRSTKGIQRTPSVYWFFYAWRETIPGAAFGDFTVFSD